MINKDGQEQICTIQLENKGQIKTFKNETKNGISGEDILYPVVSDLKPSVINQMLSIIVKIMSKMFFNTIVIFI